MSGTASTAAWDGLPWPIQVSASVHAPGAVADDPAPYAGPDSFTFVRVRVRDAEGATGDGFTGRFLAPEVAAFLNRLGDEIDGSAKDPLAEAMRRLNPRHMTGVVVSAMGALDIAMNDLRGRRRSLALWRLLGARRDRAPTHVTCGFGSLDDDALVATCAAEVEAGATGVKVLVGGRNRSIAEDAARLRKVRAALGPRVDLIADANCAWDLDAAQEMVRAVEGVDLTWLEEPVRGNDRHALRHLTDMGIVPIGAGQMEQSADRFDLLTEAGVTVIQPNAVFAGGIDATVRAAGRALEAGCTVSPAGGWDAVNLHWMCGTLESGAVELHRAQGRIARLLRPAHRVERGELVLSDAPGLGFDPDEAGLAACRVG